MKKINFTVVLLCVALSLFFFSCKKDNPKTGEVSVLTYNVAGLPAVISGSKPDIYMSHISPLLNDYNIVHVQEDWGYHDSLLLYLDKPHKTESSGIVTIGDGLNTFSDFPIHGLYREAWTDCNAVDCYTPKGFSYSRIEVQSGVFIDFYNLHCNAGSSDADLYARRMNIVQLTQYIKTHSEGQAVVAMGDFNCRYTRVGDTIRLLESVGLKDAWIELYRGGEVPAVGSTSLSNCDAPRTKPDCEKVDKIFYRSGSKVDIEPLAYMLDDPRFYYQGNDTLPLSDHWPVYAKIKYQTR